MLRIGIWFDETHCSYGGPTLVLLGAIVGLIQDANARGAPITILINEQGDVNWVVNRLRDHETIIGYIRNPLIGPMVFNHSDALTQNPTENIVWNTGKRFIIASDWFGKLVQLGLPFTSPRSLTIWPSGVDTDYFTPDSIKKSQDYFIYFKSQNFKDLQLLHVCLFQKYFKFCGQTLTYYHYTPEMLRDAARKSRFCIFVSNTETQGLAALEILACDIPMFVLDCTTYTSEQFRFEGATSVTCWDERCGMKSSLQTIQDDLPKFLSCLDTYKPREFVCSEYSFEAAGKRLRELISREHH
jgi:hypothetical protein